MPVYLAHGFRWYRGTLTGIRLHCIVHNIEDMATEYIQNKDTQALLLESFRTVYPGLMQHLEDARTGRTLHFLEEYDPNDEISDHATGKDYAFVADRVITLAAGPLPPATTAGKEPGPGDNEDKRLEVPATTKPRPSSAHSSPGPRPPPSRSSATSSLLRNHNPSALSLNVEHAMSAGLAVTPQAWEAFAELRDKLAEGEKIGWWIIYNGDPERQYPRDEEMEMESDDEEELSEDEGAKTPTQAEQYTRGLLSQPLPTILPPELKNLVIDDPEKAAIGVAVPHPPPPPLERPPPPPGGTTSARPKSSRSFTNPLRRRSSKANMQPPKNEEIPDLPKLKEFSKKEGLRHRFFGRGSDKK